MNYFLYIAGLLFPLMATLLPCNFRWVEAQRLLTQNRVHVLPTHNRHQRQGYSFRAYLHRYMHTLLTQGT